MKAFFYWKICNEKRIYKCNRALAHNIKFKIQS